MYRRFPWEGDDVHVALKFMPLAVRRKLDLAGVKLPLAGWRAFTRPERQALCHVPVHTDADAGLFREIVESFARRAGIALEPAPCEVTWRGTAPPEPLLARLDSIGVTLAPALWVALDDDTRYALVELSDPDRTPEKLCTALAELGVQPRLEGHAA